MIDTGNPTWAFIKAHCERGMTEATARLIAGTGSDERERGIILALGGILDLPKPIVGRMTTTPPAEGMTEQQEADEAAKLWAEMQKEDTAEEAEKKDKPSTGEVVSDTFSTDTTENDNAAPSAEGALPQNTPAQAASDAPAAPQPDEEALRRKAENDARAQFGRQLKRMREQYGAITASGNGPGPSAPKAVEAIAALEADYPEIATPLKSAVSQIDKIAERIDETQRAHNNDRRQEVETFLESQYGILEAKYPDWESTYTTGKTAAQFIEWVQDQPKRIRDIVLDTNRDKIFDGKGAVEVFDRFEAFRAGTQDNPPPPPANPARPTQELSPKRQAQLDGTTSPAPPGRAPVVSGIPKDVDDAQAHWNALKAEDPDEDAYRPRRRA